MTTATTTTTTTTAALLLRTRSVLACANAANIKIEAREAIEIAAADPSDAASLADSVGFRDHVPLIVAAHPGCTLRADGSIVPDGATWQIDDGYNRGDVYYPLTAGAEDVLDDQDISDWSSDTSEGPVIWDLTARLAVVTAGGYAGYEEASREFEAAQDELPQEREGCGRDGHVWHADYSVVGGIRENPGVWGHGGGVTIQEHCALCGVRRVIDTWAEDGRGGHVEKTKYREGDEDSIEYAQRHCALAALRAGHFSVRTRAGGAYGEVSIEVIASDDAGSIICGEIIAAAYIGDDGTIDLRSDGCGAFFGLTSEDVDAVWDTAEEYVLAAWGEEEEERDETAPRLPAELLDHDDGSVECVYGPYDHDQIYTDDDAAATAHQVSARTWDAIPRRRA